MEDTLKEVDFSMCVMCKYRSVKEEEEPCHECLNTFQNEYSHTPVNFEKKGE